MSVLKYEPKTSLTLRLKILNQGMAIGIHINIINVKAREQIDLEKGSRIPQRYNAQVPEGNYRHNEGERQSEQNLNTQSTFYCLIS